VVEGAAIFRIEPDRLGVVRDSTVDLALVAPKVASVVEGAGKFWIEPDRLGVVGDGAVEFALGAPGDAAGGEVVGISRVEPDRLGVVIDGAVEFALVIVFDAAIVVEPRKFLAAVSARRDGAGAGSNGGVARRLGTGPEVIRQGCGGRHRGEQHCAHRTYDDEAQSPDPAHVMRRRKIGASRLSYFNLTRRIIVLSSAARARTGELQAAPARLSACAVTGSTPQPMRSGTASVPLTTSMPANGSSNMRLNSPSSLA